MSDLKRICLYDSFMPNTVDYVDTLVRLGFFDAPASTKRHGAYTGGLFDHSFAVAQYLIELTVKLGLKWEREESPYIVGMFHDLCKCEFYERDPDGAYTYKSDLIIPGHGDRSVIMTQRFMQLTDEEIACIRWHMGSYETDTRLWNSYGAAVTKYPNVLFTHTADMYVSKVKGV